MFQLPPSAHRPTRALAVIAGSTLLIAAATGSTPALSQSLLESIFGFGQPAKPSNYPNVRPAPPGYGGTHGYPLRPGYQFSPYRPGAERGWSDDEDERQYGGGTFRTLCVRTCDGYYWPISFSTGRRGLYRDANVCQRSCGAEVRLFYTPSPAGEMTSAVDLGGRFYARLPNAFRYRKERVAGCACRPEPWSASERARHLAYGVQLGGSSPGGRLEVIAGNYDKPAGPGDAEGSEPSVDAERTGPDIGQADATEPDPSMQAGADAMATDEQPPPRKVRAERRPEPSPRPDPSGSIFGTGWQSFSGGGSQYVWPGDPPLRRR